MEPEAAHHDSQVADTAEIERMLEIEMMRESPEEEKALSEQQLFGSGLSQLESSDESKALHDSQDLDAFDSSESQALLDSPAFPDSLPVDHDDDDDNNDQPDAMPPSQEVLRPVVELSEDETDSETQTSSGAGKRKRQKQEDDEELIQMVPVTAGLWGVRVCPGRAWSEGGYGGQNASGWGTTLPPDDPRVLGGWFAGVTDVDGLQCTSCAAGHCVSNWWFTRSSAVVWDCNPSVVHFYRCGDKTSNLLDNDPDRRVYDLSCRLDDAARAWNGLSYQVAHASIQEELTLHLRGCSYVDTSASRAQAIMDCEDSEQRDPALTRLLAFECVQEVLTTI